MENVGAISCSLKGEKHAGASEAAVCAVFASRLREAKDTKIAAVRLDARANGEAIATVMDSEGAEIIKLGRSVMDRDISLDIWQRLADALAAALGKAERGGEMPQNP